MKFFTISLAVILASLLCFAQDKEYVLPDVVVTAGRIPVSFSDLTRSITVIYMDEIKNAPVNNISDLLQYAAGVDVRQRGTGGVQADVSIRGGTFEQTLIMIDGFKLSDPQTGHHNLNLPVSIDNIERIEILKGQGSKTFGANAFSGVINIITKKDATRKLFLQAEGGQHGYYNGTLNTSYSLGNFANHLSVSKNKSDGYRTNTNFDTENISYNSQFSLGNNIFNFLFGYNNKEFGANGFYSDRFPNQWEHTTTRLVSIGSTSGNDQFSISPKFYWRNNKDRFLLNYENPSFYENNHKTDVYGFEVQSSFKTVFGTSSVGLEFIKDKIESSNLGNHSREHKGLFAEQSFSPFQKLNIIAGAFAYDYALIGWKFWPGLDFSYHIIPDFRLFGSIGKAFRVPTYTDLFYSDPASKGNPNLKYEETLNYEVGINISKSVINFSLSLFRKEGRNIIDWVRESPNGLWLAMNIARLNTNGIEAEVKLFPDKIVAAFPVYGFNISYTYLDIKRELDQYTSRYILDHLKQQVVVGISNDLPFGITQTWKFRYEDRIAFEDNFVTDTKLLRNFDIVNLFLTINNLFNKSYRDYTNIPLPGRWISAGINVNLGI